MKTILVVAIALACVVGIVGTVLVVGGMYQQELFDEYVKDAQDSDKSQSVNLNLPSLDIMP